MRNAAVLPVLILILILSFFTSLFLGGSGLPVPDILRALLNPGRAGQAGAIVWEVRLPRVILGLLVGGGLGISGAVLQGMLRNPLAESYTLGVSGGAALGTIIGNILWEGNALGGFLPPACAFAGALGSTLCVYLLAGRRRFSISTLILAGIVLNLLLSSLILLLFSLSRRERIFSIFLWLMGDLSSADTSIIPAAAVLVLSGSSILLVFSKDLNLLTLGEEKAIYLGVEVESVQKLLFILVSLVAGACVSAAGIIGFVGLMIPHFIRRIAGPDHRAVLPGCFLGGSAFLVLCDAAARSIVAPIELPVGVVTGMLGGGFFLVYLVRERAWETL